MQKEQDLFAQLDSLQSLIVALSGGADSAYLAWTANEALGESALAVTAVSASLPEELSNPLYVVNSPDRCYHCKDELFTKLDVLARELEIKHVAYGVNVDDRGDFRPGEQAALEHSVLTPLLDAGMTKADIRELSRRAGLETWNKSAAACLASRLAHGVEVTEEKLQQVDKGEEALRALGFNKVRARYHGDLVRIEIAPGELSRALTPEMSAKFTEIFKALGFKFVTLDCEGYRQGSFNPESEE
jgi:uncharacterized protein